MRKLLVCLAAVTALLVMSSNLSACDGDKDAKVVKVGDKLGCAKAVAKSGCSKSAAKAGCSKSCTGTACHWQPGCKKSLADCIPTMTYKVGDKETPCRKEAKQLAGDDGKIVYVVSGKNYKDRGEAVAALTESLDKFAADLMNVRMMVGDETFQCPLSAKQKAQSTDSKVRYVALRQSFDTRENANAAVAEAGKAVEKIAMTYKVDGKPTGCAKTAGKCAKDGKKVEYCVGDQATCCPTEAGMLLARAKVMALLETLKKPEPQKAASL